MQDDDAVAAFHMLLELFDEPDVVPICREHARAALGALADRLDAPLLAELQTLRLVQDALLVHIAVDGEDGQSLSAACARDLPRGTRRGVALAFEHFAAQPLVLYRAAAERVDGALLLEPVEPDDAAPRALRLSDPMDVEPGALAFGRALHHDLDLGRHLLAFPREADEEGVLAIARAQRSGPERFRALFQAWLAAWLPRIARDGLAACFGRTRWRVALHAPHRDALLAALEHVPTAEVVELGDGDEDGPPPDRTLVVLHVPDAARGHFGADVLVGPDESIAEVECESDVEPLRAFLAPYLASYVGAAARVEPVGSRRDLDHADVRIEFVTPSEVRAPGVVRVRAELTGIEPPIWRELDVPLAATLADLHDGLVEAFGWDDVHEHAFETSIGRFAAPTAEADERVGDEFAVPVAQALTSVGEHLTWEYDLGDGWSTRVEALAIDPAAAPRFALHAGARACPPEDCGGPYGYAELVAAMRSRRHPRRRELIEWLGEPFDADHFDLAAHQQFVDELN
jgi:hypothetical protein